MIYGLRLTGTIADGAALTLLADACPDLVDAPWYARDGAIYCELLDPARVGPLKERGIDLIESEQLEGRRAESLLEAVPPIRVEGDPIVPEAIFHIRFGEPEEGSARALIERLLLLGRDDAKIIELTEHSQNLVCIKVPSPPLYLLMRARDRSEDRVTAYARQAPRFYLEWGWTHPLAAIASRALERAGRIAFVDRSGRWRIASDLRSRSIFDAIEPKLEARAIDLVPSSSTSRFVIRLRFAPGPEHEPELWLADAERFFSLEHFLQEASDEEIRRITVARLDRGDGRPLYLLRERAKPNVTRLGTRLSDLLETRGFTRNAGTDNLFLPVGRRLIPKVGREELRRMLDLESSSLVILDEDADGPKVLRVPAIEESSLADWIDLVATDRRIELDRLLERTVFSFPPMDVERPAVSAKAPPAMPPPEPEPRVLGSRKSRPATPAKEEKQTIDEAMLDDLAEIRAQARELEAQVAKGGCDDSELWNRLAELELKLGEVDEAAACLENALFFGRIPRSANVVSQLLELRAKAYDGSGADLVDLVVKDAHTPSEAAYLGARIVQAIHSGERLLDDMVQVALQTFADPGLPVSRRLAWIVLSSWHASVDDKLGLTRAREALLGAVNDRGLSELYDLPRFVRYALALEDDERGTNAERTRVEQLNALERLLVGVFGERLPELDPMANYVRVIFAVGLMRLGAPSHARELVTSVENELPVHDAPNQVLYRLYLARMAFEGTESDAGAWQNQVEQLLSSGDWGRRPAVWLAKRSIWLGRPEEKPEPKLRSLIDRILTAARDEPTDLGATLTKLATDKVYQLYDWELAAAIERLMKIALASGSEASIAEVLDAAEAHFPTITILGHRLSAIGACLEGAATIGRQQTVEALVDRIAQVVRAKDVPWVRELLFPVKRCLLILRRLGAKEPASHLLNSLEPMEARNKLEGALLAAILADGFLQLEARAQADEMIERAMSIVFDPELDYVSRYDAGAMTIDVLRHWPANERAEYYHRFAASLDHFKDLYTTSEWFEAHKILLLEKIVDGLADSATRQSDRVQAFLDLEEHAVRTKIISDWKQLCGP